MWKAHANELPMDPAEAIGLGQGDDSLGMCSSDGERVTLMVRQHLDFVWRLLRRMGVPSEQADDAAQQVFIVAAGRIRAIQGGAERSFLFSTALRVASEARRAARRRRDLPVGHEAFALECDPSPGPDEQLARKRASEALDEILDRMPDDCRTVFVLFELEQLTLPEISRLVGAPLGTVTSRLRRARELFQVSLHRLQHAESVRGGVL